MCAYFIAHLAPFKLIRGIRITFILKLRVAPHRYSISSESITDNSDELFTPKTGQLLTEITFL